MDNETINVGTEATGANTDTQSQVATPVEASKETPTEKMFTQSHVQAIAAKEARKAEEKAEARVRQEYEARLAQAQQKPNADNNSQGVPSAEEIQRLIRQEAYNMSRDHQAQEIERDWYKAINAEKAADPEFSDLYDDLAIEQQPMLILAMAGMDNKAHVVKDLAKNPSKYANILMLANGGSPKLAQMELKKLSDSIKANNVAKQQPKVDAPLSQIKSSNISGDDSNMSVSDFRNQSWLKG